MTRSGKVKSSLLIVQVFLSMLLAGVGATLLLSFLAPEIQVLSFVNGHVFRTMFGFDLVEVSLQSLLLTLLLCVPVLFGKDETSLGPPAMLLGGILVMSLAVWSAVRIDGWILLAWVLCSALQIVLGELTRRKLHAGGQSWLQLLVLPLVTLLLVGLSLKLALDYPTPRPDQTLLVNLGSSPVAMAVDIFEAPGSGGQEAAAIVILHGVEGATPLMRRSIHYPNARAVADTGFRTFFIRYFDPFAYQDLLEPDKSIDVNRIEAIRLRDYRAWIDGVKLALAAIAARPEVDENRMAIVGYSLGCYVATAVAAERADAPFPKVVVGNFGAIWPEVALDDSFPPIQFHHGTGDEVIPVALLDEAVERLGAAGAKRVEVRKYPGQGHVPSGPGAYELRPSTERFLFEHLGQIEAVGP